jgi:hypothetical protein
VSMLQKVARYGRTEKSFLLNQPESPTDILVHYRHRVLARGELSTVCGISHWCEGLGVDATGSTI